MASDEKSDSIQLEFSYTEDFKKVSVLNISPTKHRQLEAIMTGNSGNSTEVIGLTQVGFGNSQEPTTFQRFHDAEKENKDAAKNTDKESVKRKTTPMKNKAQKVHDALRKHNKRQRLSKWEKDEDTQEKNPPLSPSALAPVQVASPSAPLMQQKGKTLPSPTAISSPFTPSSKVSSSSPSRCVSSISSPAAPGASANPTPQFPIHRQSTDNVVLESEPIGRKNNIYSYFSKQGSSSKLGTKKLENKETEALEEVLRARDSKISSLELELEQLSESLRESTAQLQQRDEESRRAHEEYTEQIQRAQSQFDNYQTKTQLVLVEVLRDLAVLQNKTLEHKLLEDRLNIGRVIPVREGHMVTEMWEEGQLFQDLRRREHRLMKEKDDIDAARKKLTTKKRSSSKDSKKKDDGDTKDHQDDDGFKIPRSMSPAANNFEDLDAMEQEEILRFRSALIKKELFDVKNEEKELLGKKDTVIRLQKLRFDQLNSRFNHQPILHDRYLMMNILGKGGFSEVYKAFDIVELRYVACKIHQLDQSWSADRKKNYTRHATREYNIHKSLHNPRVVQLYDVFAIDLNSFCTVLEYCDGIDLDM